jgi:hypothetical protein
MASSFAVPTLRPQGADATRPLQVSIERAINSFMISLVPP